LIGANVTLSLNAGLASYLVKPFSEKELLDSINTALKQIEII
jgi:DNA-binding response OmpR family regulator